MPPFLQFRLWLREGPVGERVFGAVLAAIVLAVVVVALIPLGSESAGGEETNIAAPSAPTGSSVVGGVQVTPPQVVPGTGATGQVSSGGTAPGGTTSGATSAGGTGGGTVTGPSPRPGATSQCTGLRASSPGITRTRIKIVTTNISLAGDIGNDTFDIRTDLAEIAKANVDHINETGGMACGRKIVLKQYDVNPLDPNDGQSKCLDIVRYNPFMVIDFGGYITGGTRACFLQAKIPLVQALAFSQKEFDESFPYLVSPRALGEKQARQLLGLKDLGFFSAPKFRKLGLFEDKCFPSVNQEIDKTLARAGVRSDQISKYQLDCDIAAPPNQIAQAVVQHKLDNVSHVFLASSGTNGQTYLRVGGQQDFHPIYGVTDYGENTTGSGSENWDPTFNGAIGITGGHGGEWNSSIRNPQVLACNQIMRKHGVPPYGNEYKDTAVVAYCDMFNFVRRATDGAGPNPTRVGFVKAIPGIGIFKTANMGDAVFNRPGKYNGGDFRRAIQWHSNCRCWKILERSFKPAY